VEVNEFDVKLYSVSSEKILKPHLAVLESAYSPTELIELKAEFDFSVCLKR